MLKPGYNVFSSVARLEIVIGVPEEGLDAFIFIRPRTVLVVVARAFVSLPAFVVSLSAKLGSTPGASAFYYYRRSQDLSSG